MKKMFPLFVLLTICCSFQVLRADDTNNLPPLSQPSYCTGGIVMKICIPSISPERAFLVKNQIVPTVLPVVTIFLDEKDANTPEMPISVPLSSTIEISLQGEECKSLMYSSGSGSEHGYRWEYVNDQFEDDVLSMNGTCLPTTDPSHSGSMNDGWKTKKILFHFTPNKAGLTTLTFKKYYYSNAMVRNLDGSLPWKDLVEVVQFTINVLDNSAPPTSNSSN